MAAEIQKLLPHGTEALIVTTGNHIEVFPLDVIASYSELLGEPDPAKTVLLIRGAIKTADQTGMWKPLYENLQASLGELVDAGVPPEFMPDALEDATGSPIPGDRKRKSLRDGQKAVRDKVAKGSSQNLQHTSEFYALLAGRNDQIRAARADFLGNVAPPSRQGVPTQTAPPLFSEPKAAVGRPTAELEEGENGQVG